MTFCRGRRSHELIAASSGKSPAVRFAASPKMAFSSDRGVEEKLRAEDEDYSLRGETGELWMDSDDNDALLGDVLAEYFATNKRGWKTLADVASAASQMKEFTTYFHASIPYVSTVFLISRNGERWVNLKINTDGYVFARKLSTARVARHNHDQWVQIPRSQHAKFEGVIAHVQPPWEKVKIWYNEHVKKIDIKLFSADAGTPHLLIGFEQGFPDMDYDDTNAVSLNHPVV